MKEIVDTVSAVIETIYQTSIAFFVMALVLVLIMVLIGLTFKMFD